VPQLRMKRCEHVFHEACLLSWLTGGISLVLPASDLEVLEAGRKGVPCASCALCVRVREMVGETERVVNALDVEDLVERIKAKSGRSVYAGNMSEREVRMEMERRMKEVKEERDTKARAKVGETKKENVRKGLKMAWAYKT
jgi:hypothetical protein